MSKHKIQGNVELGTFGKTKAAINLARILDELNNKKITQLVGRTWDEYRSILKSIIEEISVAGHACFLINLFHDYTQGKIKSKNFPKEVESHFLNIVMVEFRKAIEKKKLFID